MHCNCADTLAQAQQMPIIILLIPNIKQIMFTVARVNSFLATMNVQYAIKTPHIFTYKNLYLHLMHEGKQCMPNRHKNALVMIWKTTIFQKNFE